MFLFEWELQTDDDVKRKGNERQRVEYSKICLCRVNSQRNSFIPSFNTNARKSVMLEAALE
jgi:hypothetical protein